MKRIAWKIEKGMEMLNYDDWKLATPPNDGASETPIEKCDKCGGDVYWYERGDCRGQKIVYFKGAPHKYYKVTIFTCKKCQNK